MLESALVIPIKGTQLLTVPSCKLSYPLIKQRWFAKAQAKELCVSDELFERYYADSLKISKQSLVRTILSNGTYAMKETLKNTTAKTLVIVGGRELSAMKKSARLLTETIPQSRLHIAEGMKHGELSLRHPKEYAQLLEGLFAQSKGEIL